LISFRLLVWFGSVWFGLVRFGLVCIGLVWFGFGIWNWGYSSSESFSHSAGEGADFVLIPTLRRKPFASCSKVFQNTTDDSRLFVAAVKDV
jgi:hypothetical protein